MLQAYDNAANIKIIPTKFEMQKKSIPYKTLQTTIIRKDIKHTKNSKIHSDASDITIHSNTKNRKMPS